LKQAESASRAAESLMASGGSIDSNPADVKELKDALAKAEKDAEVAKKDVNSMKTQSESLAKEYDRLMEEKDRLERKVNIMGGEKKDD